MPVLKVKENGEWLNVGSIAGGITVDTTNSNIGTPNGINADTLGGHAKEYYAKSTDLAGCWIEFTDEDGNPTEEPYIHWLQEV